MADVDFTTLMTTEAVAQARRGGEIVRQHRTGEKLRKQIEEAFAVGRGLMIGRATAMRAANAGEPRGRPYVEAFAKWMWTRLLPGLLVALGDMRRSSGLETMRRAVCDPILATNRLGCHNGYKPHSYASM